MPLLIVSLGILFLFFLIVICRLNAFIAFIIVAIGIGIGQGMPLDALVGSVEKGIGNTLGFLVMILGLGAMLGKLVAESGAAQQITNGLIRIFGVKNTKAAIRKSTNARKTMKKSRFTETQIISLLKEADAGMKVEELCRKHGISPASYYN